MKILGIDPGLADAGYGIIEQEGPGTPIRHVAHGVISTSGGGPMSGRLNTIFERLSELIREHKPDAVAIEELFFAANLKTAIVVAQARGVAILATAQSAIPLAEYSPPQIKMALVGYGRANKSQVQMMVRAVLGLKEIPRPDHAADALAVAVCHLHSMSSARRKAEKEVTMTEDTAESNPATDHRLLNKALLAQRRPRKRR